ncbi:uncharacterized protein LOC103992696 isoform X2 [Musa acuminata AAA Group]|uniref:uncharacterized protein LOC103992696 isoform X2 n=1 Tax=Musa acuminata AAA Group TaxID=214697 RepID=UPI0031D50BC4
MLPLHLNEELLLLIVVERSLSGCYMILDQRSLLSCAMVLDLRSESEGVFQFGDYWKEAEDLHAVVLYFSEQKYEISAIVGHSKGGDDVLLYASRYRDVHTVVNLSGRFALDRGIERFLGKDFIQRIKKDGFIDVVDKTGKVLFRVTEESLMDRLNIDMHAACLSIDKGCRVFTVHGSADEIIPVEDALEIAKLIPSHKLHIIEGANHCYTEHQEELAKTVGDFLTSIQIVDAAVAGEL